MSAALAQFLTDFSATDRPEQMNQINQVAPESGQSFHKNAIGNDFNDPFMDDVNGGIDVQDPEPNIDIEFEKQQAYDRGFASAKQSLEQEHQQAMAALKDAHQAQISALDSQLGAAVTQSLSDKIAKSHDRLLKDIQCEIYPFLQLFISEKLAEQSAKRLLDETVRLIDDSQNHTIELSGPEKLIEFIRPELEKITPNIQCQQTDTVDLKIEFGPTILKTAMSNWVSMLADDKLGGADIATSGPEMGGSAHE